MTTELKPIPESFMPEALLTDESLEHAKVRS